MAFHSKRALPFGPHFLSLLVKHVTASASQHLCVRVCVCTLLFRLHFNDSPDLQSVFFSDGCRLWLRARFPCVVGVLARSQHEDVPSMYCLFWVCFCCFCFQPFQLLCVFMGCICCQSWRYSARSQGLQSVQGNA